jgi:SnoaL-like domain
MGDDESTVLAGPRTSTGQMTRTEVVVFFKRRQEAFDNLDAAALAVDYAADCHLESPTAGIVAGRADIEKVFRAWFDAFLDLKIRTDSLVIDGTHVAQDGSSTKEPSHTSYAPRPVSGEKSKTRYKPIGLGPPL